VSTYKEMPVASKVPYNEKFDWPSDVSDTRTDSTSDPVIVHQTTADDVVLSEKQPLTPNMTFQEAYDMSIRDMLIIRKTKRNDYVGNDLDDLRNYRSTGQFLGTTTYQVMLARIFEKLQRCRVLILENTEQAVNDETIADTLLDIANIALLVKAALDTGDDGR